MGSSRPLSAIESARRLPSSVAALRTTGRSASLYGRPCSATMEQCPYAGRLALARGASHEWSRSSDPAVWMHSLRISAEPERRPASRGPTLAPYSPRVSRSGRVIYVGLVVLLKFSFSTEDLLLRRGSLSYWLSIRLNRVKSALMFSTVWMISRRTHEVRDAGGVEFVRIGGVVGRARTQSALVRLTVRSPRGQNDGCVGLSGCSRRPCRFLR